MSLTERQLPFYVAPGRSQRAILGGSTVPVRVADIDERIFPEGVEILGFGFFLYGMRAVLQAWAVELSTATERKWKWKAQV